MENDYAKWRTKDNNLILRFFLCIPVSAAVAAVNPNGIKTLLANGLTTFFINGIEFLVMDQELCQEIPLIVSS